ncbi:complex I 51 kDa subunit family protein [Candidatus Formimonas warabiya]|uniref:NADH-quinone oxidoreductase subunit F n=1 Tax=Formimonas warabiya TaxID=1761012 RepID=A0A3G1KMH9_FORW1|nr:NADH-ubiquinone oxidoreductase-F iron-sulfur binding region domain-containing protein [Candidatus Formimonas warabiya]ATW23662.1 NADH-quinone oxidoreductase subunit F [Candidatus Formimonas warabiya]
MAEELRVVLRNLGKINPTKIDDYLDAGGYQALEKARGMSKAEVIEEVKKSGLRGRGGAGFNTGQKWFFAHSLQVEEKYVVCNADEGEPGTYKDRIIMENDPHSLLEGMAICAYAIGSRKGFIYCRGEYPHLVQTLKNTVAQAKEKGVLGDFDIEVRMGAGAYVCGEETALIESLEGNRGEPRYRPPYPPVSGLWKKPTIVNNVETFANIAPIMEKGSAWFAGIGAANFPGTKVLTLTGDVKNTTFIEVPTDTTVREVIFQFGQGITGDKKFKAVQIGGTSGGFLPETLLDTPIDFDSMRKAGATLGSGAVFVLAEDRDILDVVTRIAKFFEHESCGKCAPCREGTMRIRALLEKINSMQGSKEDVALLEKLGRVMAGACLCGLGQAAPTPVITTIHHFGIDYDAKIQ